MIVRVLAAGAAKPNGGKALEAEVARLKASVLAAQDQRWRESSDCERMGDRRQLDRFRPGSDDQPDIRGIQSSPYLGGRNVPSVQSGGKWRETNRA